MASFVIASRMHACACRTVDENLALNAKAREVYQVKARKARARAQRPPVPDYYMQYDEVSRGACPQ